MPTSTVGYPDPLASIIEGTVADEDPADILYLCGYMALALFSHTVDPQYRNESRRYYELLERSGKILCPILDLLKPTHYVEAMIEVRRGYAGIANDVGLQADYGRQIQGLIAEGAIQDLQTAIQSDLPSRLGIMA